MGRLFYLTSLRDPNTGRYEHHGLSVRFGQYEADRALRQSHSQSFSEWLCFDLEQQKADLDLYLSAMIDDRRAVVETWMRLAPYRNVIPISATATEMQLYLSDFKAILEVLRIEYGVAEADPGA